MANFFDEFSFYRLPFPLPSRTLLPHLRSLFISSQICLLIIIVFFLNETFTSHTYTHSYTHIHTQCTDVRAKERKDVSFRDFFLFRIIKKKKNIDPSIVEKKNISCKETSR